VRYDQTLFVGLHVKYSLFLSDFNESWFVRQLFRKYSSMKFHENLSIVSQPSCSVQMDRHDDVHCEPAQLFCADGQT